MSGLRTLAILFVLLNGVFLSANRVLAQWGIDVNVVIGGNLLLFIVTLISALLSRRSLKASNPNAFVRAMYASVMIKLFACIIAAFVYFTVVGKSVNKPGLFVCMGLYVIYTVVEISSLTKLLRAQKNA
jgi:hypothetical protein